MSARIEAQGLSKSFHGRRAVDGLSLNIGAGEAYGLVGPDGAGKTTTLRLLVGALLPDEGAIRVSGHDLRRQPDLARERIGYLAQRFSLYGDLTVWENLGLFGSLRGLRGELLSRRAQELARFVGLEGFEARQADQLSGGMKQRLGLACALVHQPEVLLLDEPTAGVDPVARQDFWQLIIRVLAEGAAVLITTPYMDEAERCSRVGFLHSGRLLVEGPPRELARSLEGRVLELAGEPADVVRRVAAADPEVQEVVAFGDHINLRVRNASGPLARLPEALASAGAQVRRLREVRASLEDVFVSLLEETASLPAEAGKPEAG